MAKSPAKNTKQEVLWLYNHGKITYPQAIEKLTKIFHMMEQDAKQYLS